MFKEMYGNKVYEDGRIVSRFGHQMTPQRNKKGYYTVQVFWGEPCIRRTIAVHRLVAEAFLGKPPEGYEVNHKDCNRANNHIDNLEYLTHSENVRYSYLAGGRDVSGQKNANNKHSAEVIHKICSHLERTPEDSNSHIARLCGVLPATVSLIRNKKQWTSISKSYNI